MTRLALTFIVGVFLFVAGGTGGAWALSKYPWSGKTNAHVCNMVKNGEGWGLSGWFEEAKRRGLTCGVKETNSTQITSSSTPSASTQKETFDVNAWILKNTNNNELCSRAVHNFKFNNLPNIFVSEAYKRNIDCGLNRSEFNDKLKAKTNLTVCSQARDRSGNKIWWRKEFRYLGYVKEAFRRGLHCDVSKVINPAASLPLVQAHRELAQIISATPSTPNPTSAELIASQRKTVQLEAEDNRQEFIINLSAGQLCHRATFFNDETKSYEFKAAPFSNNAEKLAVSVARDRGLTCFVKKKSSTQTASTVLDDNYRTYVSQKSDRYVCRLASLNSEVLYPEMWQVEVKNRGINCLDLGYSYNWKKSPSIALSSTQRKITSAELTAAQRKTEQLEAELAAIKAEQAEASNKITSDTQVPLITITASSSNGPQGTISGRVSDNAGVGEVRVDGQLIQIDNNGSFTANTYVPEGGVSVMVEAVDVAGLSSSMSVRLDRVVTQTAAFSFDRLNPIKRKAASNPDALALIIGVADYKETNATAVYADSDAKVFTDYAVEKLGVPRGRIKTLVNDGADEKDVLLAVKRWLSRGASAGKTDVYIFFAGHGLASDDGQKMYLLPYDGAPELLEKTAILRQELFDDVASTNPRSVTVFLDTCYSGTTRGTDMLIASRPIGIRALAQSIPDNFTVMTAAAGDQTAKPLEEAKHGMFSYFLMKGMEGEADTNQDDQITAGELHAYVEQNVVQQSSGSQTPELQGDASRVLVRFQ